jgi:hypothetical protein
VEYEFDIRGKRGDARISCRYRQYISLQSRTKQKQRSPASVRHFAGQYRKPQYTFNEKVGTSDDLSGVRDSFTCNHNRKIVRSSHVRSDSGLGCSCTAEQRQKKERTSFGVFQFWNFALNGTVYLKIYAQSINQ